MVEENLERNRKMRERQLRKKQGLPPIRRRRKPSELAHVTDPRTSRVRAERRQQEQASRVDDGELGPGFSARRPPRCDPPSSPCPLPPHPLLLTADDASAALRPWYAGDFGIVMNGDISNDE